MTAQNVDPGELTKRQALLLNYAIGAQTSAMIYLGLELRLYEALTEGAATSDELAVRTGLRERWLREWLQQQAAARVLEYDTASRQFSISPEVSFLLADVDELRSMRSNFAGLSYRFGMLDRLPESFRTGIGIPWDDRGPRGAEATEALFRNWYRQVLVPIALPMLGGVVQALKGGGAAADIGCGSGLALIEMAKAFPRAQLHGYETSSQAIERGREHARDAGVANVTFHDAIADPLPDAPTYDLICTLDCLHDMTNPHEIAAAIKRAIKQEGAWFIADINGAESFEENLRTRPLSPMLYAISVISCMSSALSEEGGAGYGTLGLPEPAMRELAARAGFSRFRRLDGLTHPINAYYEARL
jgi:2-polyprenyl-3-methyl-5-hydroxy-6-metoxy-1,4-benzoquinol methylase